MSNRPRVLVLVALFVAGALVPAQTQSPGAITSPRAAFGADIGADYFLATYRQLESYWKTLDAQSDRVMLVDIGLPQMNGYEVARTVRADPALEHVVLIALTGYGTAEDRARSRAAGFDHHLVKPVNVDALRDVVGSVVPA